MKINKCYPLDLAFAIVLIILDLFSKSLAVQFLSGRDIAIIKNVLELHYLENTGAAFSLLSGKMIFFYVITPVLCVIILYVYFKIPKATNRFTPLRICLVFLIAGAIGNYIDRIFLHYVRDFIYFKLINFPVFNVADIYVTCSIFFIIILILFVYKEEELNFLNRNK